MAARASPGHASTAGKAAASLRRSRLFMRVSCRSFGRRTLMDSAASGRNHSPRLRLYRVYRGGCEEKLASQMEKIRHFSVKSLPIRKLLPVERRRGAIWSNIGELVAQVRGIGLRPEGPQQQPELDPVRLLVDMNERPQRLSRYANADRIPPLMQRTERRRRTERNAEARLRWRPDELCRFAERSRYRAIDGLGRREPALELIPLGLQLGDLEGRIVPRCHDSA